MIFGWKSRNGCAIIAIRGCTWLLYFVIMDTSTLQKIDFHSHSILSHDGAITLTEYTHVLQKGILDIIAITDHHTIEYAKKCQEILGEKIIIGEEMTTKQGHLIGLFLTHTIPSGESVGHTIQKIKDQGGLVYVPHAFDVSRKGLGERVLKNIVQDIDIIEGFNGRIIFRAQNTMAQKFAKQYAKSMATGSDAHCLGGLGSSYTCITGKVSKVTIQKELPFATYHFGYQLPQYFLCPTLNKIKKIFT